VRESAGILTLNSSVWNRAENSKGEVYGTEYFTSEAHAKNPTAGFVEFEILTMQQIMSGETIYMNTTELNRENPFYPYGMMHGFIVDAPAGIGYTYKNVEECGQCSITSCGHPRQSASMETDIPGLFSCIQALTYYGQAQAFGQGWVSGAAAAIAADEIDLPEISFSEVQDILKKAYGYLAASGGAGGIRSVKVLESIRDASYYALQLPRNDKSLQAGLDEYKRIRTEDVPKMYCGSQSRILNYDWKNAMEVENALICCEACAQSSFTRKETRPWFYRSDYQKIDNDNWLKNITCTYNGDGNWTVGTSEVNASRVSVDEIKGMLRPVDMTAEFK
jgi:succinate dehydrogenase/fumarate reductase flavoprotein subunit